LPNQHSRVITTGDLDTENPVERIRLARKYLGTLLLAALAAGIAAPACAEPITIVALGASNTAGRGVAPQESFPAVLEAILRARGHDVRVINAGVSGDTPAGMLARLNSSVPPGTRVVVLNPGGNDLRCGKRHQNECGTAAEHEATIAQIVGRLRARDIKVVMAKFGSMPDSMRQADGRHLTPGAHRMVANRLAPQVIAAIGRSGQ